MATGGRTFVRTCRRRWREILEAVADRSAMEQVFHDLKEVHGVGQAQTRNYWSNVAVYHLNLWWHTLIELVGVASASQGIGRSPAESVGRCGRVGHRMRTGATPCAVSVWRKNFKPVRLLGAVPRKIQSLWRRVVRLVA